VYGDDVVNDWDRVRIWLGVGVGGLAASAAAGVSANANTLAPNAAQNERGMKGLLAG